MAVHDVDVNQVGPAALNGRDLRAEDREIGRQDRRRDPHGHRLTSSEIGSPGAIWKPACGFCRKDDAGGDAGVRDDRQRPRPETRARAADRPRDRR